LQEGRAGDELFKIYGILNGTCNYILSEIESAGTSFSVALAQAQKLGYAEQDPTDDVDGLDARAKLAILSRVGLNSEVAPDAVSCHSIRPVETIDFDYARYLGCTIRQISWAELEESRLFATVGPALVGLSSPLARVQGSQNLVMSTGKFGGETVFAGHGAGGNPTAVAIVSDLVAIAGSKNRDSNLVENKISRPAVTADFTARHYLRFKVKDRPGIISSLSSILACCHINIDSVLQKPGYSKSDLPFVISLEACKFSEVQNAMREMEKLDFLTQPCLHLPVLEQAKSAGAM
jgi:homoserine dehydrogenase